MAFYSAYSGSSYTVSSCYLPMSPWVGANILYLFLCKLTVSIKSVYYQWSANRGEGFALFNKTNHRARDAVVLGNLPISTRIGADCFRIRRGQFFPTIGAFVSFLFFVSCPPAIGRRIVTVVVNAFDRHSRWWRWPIAHVGEEVFKCVPSFAHFDAATTVIRKPFCSRVVTATEHPVPHRIFRPLFHSWIIREDDKEH
jgi:hypothetical protein